MSKKEENIVGTKIGIYEVLYECDFKSNDGHRMFHVKCTKCGWETNKQMHQIQYVKECKHKNRFGEYITLGKIWKNKRIRNIFKGVLDRCYNPNDKNFKTYGGKGIKVCQEWIENHKLFELWSLENGYKDNLTIDRIDSNKDYCPENCQWITLGENSRRANANFIEVNGKTLSGTQWAKELNLGCNTINKLSQKYSIDLVKEFIKRRMENSDKIRSYPKQSWMNVYGLE